MLKIKTVERGGIGEEIGLEKGDEVLAFDHHKAVDILDYLYYDAREKFVITVKQTNGDVSDCEIEKDDDERLGLVFENDNLEIRTCRNNCIFCFVDQMPKGMRETLYVKDDDYRQSFLCGNFVTLTNITEEDAERIIRLKLSPLYISVHTMNGELRKKMMRNRFADKTIDYIKRFAANGIIMNTQIVMARDHNDGKELEYSARELFKLYPNVRTMAVVPVGMTKFRENLTKIRDIDKDYALEVIDLIRSLNKEFGINFIQPADEFYFRAGIDVEPYEFYGEFPQIENGVGMTAKFKKELIESLEKRENKARMLIMVGTSAYPFIDAMARIVENYVDGLKVFVKPVENKFFGSTVNCTGLLTGGDLVEAANGFKEDYDYIVLPKHVLKEKSDIFLDGMTVGEMEKKTGKKIIVSDGSGEGFFASLSGKKEI